MNILLNNYCNLQCPYCFANEVIQQDKHNMSFTDFVYVLNFLKKSRDPNVRLIGGEPTLHPNFLDFVDIVAQDELFKHLHIFTNGTFKVQIRDKLINIQKTQKEVSLLLNLNSPKNTNIREEQYYHILDNIKHMNNIRNLSITLGINIFKQDQDVEYIVELSKRYGFKKIRWTIVSPNTDVLKHINMIEYFMGLKDQQMRFLGSCIQNDIEQSLDCNQMPYCTFTDEEVKYLQMMMPDVIARPRTCSPVLDVKPNLEVIRCFMFQDKPVYLKDFNDENQLTEYFKQHIDSKFIDVQAIEDCKTCPYFKKTRKSCGCLGFYRDKVNL